jgi:hypothetical protein
MGHFMLDSEQMRRRVDRPRTKQVPLPSSPPVGLPAGFAPAVDRRHEMPMDQRRLNEVYAWLLTLPAILLLVAFTHYPTLATLWDSFFSTPRGRRPKEFIGLDQYRRMFLDDPVFMQVLWNSFLYALVTIPLSIGLALLMALWVNERLLGRARLPAHGLFHADGPADGGGGQYLALLLHAGLRPFEPDHRPLRRVRRQLPRLARHRALERHGRLDLEGGRVLHDLLPGSACSRSRRA